MVLMRLKDTKRRSDAPVLFHNLKIRIHGTFKLPFQVCVPHSCQLSGPKKVGIKMIEENKLQPEVLVPSKSGKKGGNKEKKN